MSTLHEHIVDSRANQTCTYPRAGSLCKKSGSMTAHYHTRASPAFQHTVLVIPAVQYVDTPCPIGTNKQERESKKNQSVTERHSF